VFAAYRSFPAWAGKTSRFGTSRIDMRDIHLRVCSLTRAVFSLRLNGFVGDDRHRSAYTHVRKQIIERFVVESEASTSPVLTLADNPMNCDVSADFRALAGMSLQRAG
jgi:hypothetical protein